MASPELLWEGGPSLIQAEHFRFTTDSVLLASFASANGSRRGIDLGCASGILSVILLEENPKTRMTGLELNPEAAALARENMLLNGYSDRSEIVQGDIREHKKLFRPGAFDFAVCNPPYYPAGSGAVPADPARAAARGETACSISDIVSACSYLVRTGGSLFLVHKPERLSELMCVLSSTGLEPKRLRLVCSAAGAAPSLILLEARRGGKPGLKILPELALRGPDGRETEEIQKIYHR